LQIVISRVLPIEVKSGKNYQRHRALNNVLTCDEYNIIEAIVFCNDNVSVVGKVVYYPIYFMMFLYKEIIPDVKFSLDLKGL
jgi:hypothetical protein